MIFSYGIIGAAMAITAAEQAKNASS